jgi:hypothetical protein
MEVTIVIMTLCLLVLYLIIGTVPQKTKRSWRMIEKTIPYEKVLKKLGRLIQER